MESFQLELQKINEKLNQVLNGDIKSKMQNDILTNEKVCQKLGVSSKTLKSYRDRGLISFSKVGKKIFYRPKDVDDFIEQFHCQRFKRSKHA